MAEKKRNGRFLVQKLTHFHISFGLHHVYVKFETCERIEKGFIAFVNICIGDFFFIFLSFIQNWIHVMIFTYKQATKSISRTKEWEHDATICCIIYTYTIYNTAINENLPESLFDGYLLFMAYSCNRLTDHRLTDWLTGEKKNTNENENKKVYPPHMFI